MEKIKEPNETEIVYECGRCGQDYCEDCQSSVTVDFEVEDKSEGFNTLLEQWKDRKVCPWCYNQLIDIAQEQEVKNEKKNSCN